MSDNTVVLNGNDAPFVPDEADAASGETNITPGHFLELTSSSTVQKHSSEPSLDTKAHGRGMVAVPSKADFSHAKADKYNTNDDGERVFYEHIPVGGKVDAFVEAGNDLTDSSNANVSEGDVLVEGPNGGLMVAPGTDTTGDGTGSGTETVHDMGALYEAQESVDNSSASSGVSNQSRIEVKRIA